MGGIEGESVTVTWKSQDPAPLPETGITKSKEAQVELPLLKNICRSSDSHQSLQHGCKLPSLVWKQTIFYNTVIINLLVLCAMYFHH